MIYFYINYDELNCYLNVPRDSSIRISEFTYVSNISIFLQFIALQCDRSQRYKFADFEVIISSPNKKQKGNLNSFRCKLPWKRYS